MKTSGLLLGAVLVLFTVAGCGGGTPASGPVAPPPDSPPTVSPLGPRPQTLRLDGVNPCALLTPAQVSALKVRAGEFGTDDDGLGSTHCLWRNAPDKPGLGWLARLTPQRGAEWYRDNDEGTPTEVVQISGYPTVQTASSIQDPDTHCLLVVDAAPGQSLLVQFVNMDKDYPGMNHQRACQFARQAAESMVTNLRGLAR